MFLTLTLRRSKNESELPEAIGHRWCTGVASSVGKLDGCSGDGWHTIKKNGWTVFPVGTK